MAVILKTKENGLTQHAKLGWQTFCEYSSIHGFSELYHAKSLIWKTFWFLCLCAAFAVTTYQVNDAITEYMGQDSITLIQPVKTSEVIYPPIKLCYTHWVYWANFTKAYEMNFTRQSILYAMSYIGYVFTLDTVNLVEAPVELMKIMKKNNMTTLSDFYKAIAKRAPIDHVEDEYFVSDYFGSGPVPQYFKKMEIMTYKMNRLNRDILFCYVQDGYDILQYIKGKATSVQTAKQSNNAFVDYVKSNVDIINFAVIDVEDQLGKFAFDVSDIEYNRYMLEWLDNKTLAYFTNGAKPNNDQPSFFAPMIIFPDGYSSNIGTLLTREIDEYMFTIKTSVHKWKSRKENPCNNSLRSVLSDVSCLKKACIGTDYSGNTKSWYYELHLIGKDEPQNMYTYHIDYLEESNSISNQTDEGEEEVDEVTSAATTPASHHLTTSTKMTLEPNDSILEVQKKNCSGVCLIGCEKWNFDVFTSTTSIYNSAITLSYKGLTNVKIVYPIPGDILIMIEVDSQSWQNLIGNVGGLLGIWTGASIVSFIQMIYLLCCTDCNRCEREKEKVIPSKRSKT